MSRFFSAVEFGGKTYLLAGSVAFSDLANFKPLVDFLMTKDKTETEHVWLTHCWLLGTEPNRDLTDEELPQLSAAYSEFISAGIIEESKVFHADLAGLLPEPFEDFYKLEGAQREQYLKLKATAKAEHDALCARLKADGLNDDEIVEWLRYYRRSGGK